MLTRRHVNANATRDNHEADGKAFVLLSRAAYEGDLDVGPRSRPEMDVLADEAMQLVSVDGLDEDDEA